MAENVFLKIADNLNSMIKSKNYQVAPARPIGKPGSNDKRYREYRLQLINKELDTSAAVIDHLGNQLKKDSNIKLLKFNDVSPNSSKFPSYSFTFDDQMYDIVIARGANNGEKFEIRTVKNLDTYFKIRQHSEMSQVIQQMNESYLPFVSAEIVAVKQRTGSTRKEGIAIEKLGAIIGDIVLTDSTGNDWFVSLKDIRGTVISAYSGAPTIFDKKGTLQPNSVGAKFLNSFGVDLNKVQAGFDERANINTLRPNLPYNNLNQTEIETIFNRVWGMNYFYVRRLINGWKVFWLGKEKLDKLCRGMKVDGIRYPDKKSKQISIFCSNGEENYIIEIRNSSRGEYPNDIKFKVKK